MQMAVRRASKGKKVNGARKRRWDAPRPKRAYKKVHGVKGRITGVMTAICLTDDDVHDIKMFWPMVAQMLRNGLCVKRIYADGAYPSQATFVATLRKGIELWAPVRGDWNPETKKVLGRDRATAIKERNDIKNPEFMKEYRGRNRSECAWSQLKLQFGGFLWSRKLVERMNEILCKAIAYNLCRINQYEVEWGTRIDFGLNSKFQPRWGFAAAA
jgi:hypothetical protein